MQKILLPFAPWEPDKAAYGGEQNMRARNVIPASSGYKPFPEVLPSDEALPGKVLGALGSYTASGEPFTLAGLRDGLYLRFLGDWEKKSPAIVGSELPWSFTLYGNNLIASNGVDTPLYASIGLGQVSDFAPIPGAPVASSCAVVDNFLMLGRLAGNQRAVRWSSIDNPLGWPQPGTNEAQYQQSDIQVFPEGGNVQAIASGMSAYEGLIFCESAIYRAQYVGSPYIFQFTDVDKNRGTIAPRSVIQANNLVYFLCEDGFYATDGATVKNIGLGRVNLWWRENSRDQRRNETIAVYNPVAGVIAWAFASNSCPDDRFDRLLIFHPELNRFSLVFQDLNGYMQMPAAVLPWKT